MDCPDTQDIIKRYLENQLDATAQEALQDHLATCERCAEAVKEFKRVAEVLQDALVPKRSVQPALSHITERLAQQPVPALSGRRARLRQGLAAAALLLIVTGLGFIIKDSLSRSDSKRPSVPLAMQVAEARGTVLVKHRDATVWQVLKPNDAIYLGDTFHTAATASLVLGLDKNAHVKVAPNSMLVLESYDDKETQFYLEHGQCTPVLNGPHGPFFIRTPNGRMQALGTEFTVKVTE